MLKRFLPFLLTFLAIFLVFPQTASAAFLTVTPDGTATWNVLSYSDELVNNKRESLQVTDVANTPTVVSDAQVYLSSKDGKIAINIKSASGETEKDVTGYKDSLVQLVERDKPY